MGREINLGLVLSVLGSIASLYCGFRPKIKKCMKANEFPECESVVLVAANGLMGRPINGGVYIGVIGSIASIYSCFRGEVKKWFPQ